MNYKSRIRQIEKKSTASNGDIVIEVRVGDECGNDYAIYRARKKLGLISPNEKPKQIFVVGPEEEERYDDMTVEQAKEILKNAG
ncbi:hypothetical protein [Desulfotignum balticum]|jgi:uncharacterized membrane protein|uniref:hypothetical protein n=1 Tax=Desulfotignum balticum TaxID=115781 RepID=UPI0003F853F4|nr:hypothetical protein [Desulfotignum balticum]